MTGKAARKKLKKASRARHDRPRASSPWRTVGAVVASAAFAATPRLVTAHELDAAANARSSAHGAPIGVSRLTRDDFADPRLVLLDEVFRRAASAFDAGRSGDGITLQDPPARRYDIAAGPLTTVVPAFEQASGVKVVLAIESIGSIQSPGVYGTFTVEQALAALLDGLGLSFQFTSPNSVTLDLQRLSESVDVAGRLPEVSLSSPNKHASHCAKCRRLSR